MLGLILAGGRSRRFGRPKALARVGGVTFLERVYHALEEVVDGVALSASPSTPAEAVELARRLGAIIAWDDPGLPCMGPPRGVASAYLELRPEAMLIVGVDYPFITSEALNSIIAHARCLRAHSLTPYLYEGYPLVTLGYADHHALELLVRACRVKPKARLTDLYRQRGALVAGWSLYTPNPRVLANVNRPEDLEAEPRPPRAADIRRPAGEYYEAALEAMEAGERVAAMEALEAEAVELERRRLLLLARHAMEDYSSIEESYLNSTGL